MVVLLGIAMPIPKPLWVAAGVMVGLGFLVRWVRTVARHRSSRASTRGAGTEHNQDCSMEEDTDLVQLTTDPPGTEPGEFAVPSPPRDSGRAKWIPPGRAVQVAGVTILDGMVYVGTRLPPLHFFDVFDDVCLINPSEPVAGHGDCRQMQHGRVPDYAALSAQSRRAYLNWLADGRRHPDADLGFVQLFFFGIERRVLNNPHDTYELEADAPDLADELSELVEVYGVRSGEFRRVAATLLALLTAIAPPPRLYEQPTEVLQG